MMTPRGLDRSPPIPASTACWPRRASTPCRSTCCAGGRLEQVAELAARNPDTTLVIDHLGLRAALRAAGAAPSRGPSCPSCWRWPPHDNVVVKISGACTLSHEPFPYKDIWDPLGRIFDAFGLDRCMWGTDWTRAVALLTYKQGVDAFRVTDRLSDSDRATLMGGSLSKIYGWAPKKG